MYQVGDQVVYGIHGVCRVMDHEQRLVDGKKLTYLVVEPVGQDGSRFLVPTHNATAMAKLRSMLSKEEMEALILSDAVHSGKWIQDENRRKQTYRELISSGDRGALLQMVCTLYKHRSEQATAGKKCHLCDENFLRDAERLLVGEISIVMEMEPDQARAYIRKSLQN